MFKKRLVRVAFVVVVLTTLIVGYYSLTGTYVSAVGSYVSLGLGSSGQENIAQIKANAKLYA